MNAETVRLLLIIFLFAIYTLSMFYLRSRLLPLGGFVAWGLFALLVPALGPFLVVLCQPGSPRPLSTKKEH